ncbi:hypothetical protein [Umboniibacter marinipuniceus]|uniref:hypothetical protein n=1 Tax=Umboniibacter marinipuniceus TaxID=569599 RepID=UPI0011C452A9|nr:hypothetical protein [Umboniibacter marinipuniceus]
MGFTQVAVPAGFTQVAVPAGPSEPSNWHHIAYSFAEWLLPNHELQGLCFGAKSELPTGLYGDICW